MFLCAIGLYVQTSNVDLLETLDCFELKKCDLSFSVYLFLREQFYLSGFEQQI